MLLDSWVKQIQNRKNTEKKKKKEDHNEHGKCGWKNCKDIINGRTNFMILNQFIDFVTYTFQKD